MRCKEFPYRASEALDGRLDAHASNEFEQHLKDCARCRSNLARLRQAEDAARLLSPIEPRAEFTDRVMEQVRTGERRRRLGFLAPSRWRFPLSAAAALLITAALTVLLLLPPQKEPEETPSLPPRILPHPVAVALEDHATRADSILRRAVVEENEEDSDFRLCLLRKQLEVSGLDQSTGRLVQVVKDNQDLIPAVIQVYVDEMQQALGDFQQTLESAQDARIVLRSLRQQLKDSSVFDAMENAYMICISSGEVEASENSDFHISFTSVHDERMGSLQEDARQFLVAQNFYFQHRFEQASDELECLVERHPDSPLVKDAIYWLGEISLKRGQLQEAFQEWRRLPRRHLQQMWEPGNRAFRLKVEIQARRGQDEVFELDLEELFGDPLDEEE